MAKKKKTTTQTRPRSTLVVADPIPDTRPAPAFAPSPLSAPLRPPAAPASTSTTSLSSSSAPIAPHLSSPASTPTRDDLVMRETFRVFQANGYRLGLEEGKAQGIAEGRRIGVDEGKALGIEEGRKMGYEEGRAAFKREAVAQRSDAPPPNVPLVDVLPFADDVLPATRCPVDHSELRLLELIREATEKGHRAGFWEATREGRMSRLERELAAAKREQAQRDRDHEQYLEGFRVGRIRGLQTRTEAERERAQKKRTKASPPSRPTTAAAVIQTDRDDLRMFMRSVDPPQAEKRDSLDPSPAQSPGDTGGVGAKVVTHRLSVPAVDAAVQCDVHTSPAAPHGASWSDDINATTPFYTRLSLPTPLPSRDLSSLRSDTRPPFQTPFGSLKRRARRHFHSRRVLPASHHPHPVVPLDWSGDYRLQDLSHALTALGWTRPP